MRSWAGLVMTYLTGVKIEGGDWYKASSTAGFNYTAGSRKLALSVHVEASQKKLSRAHARKMPVRRVLLTGIRCTAKTSDHSSPLKSWSKSNISNRSLMAG